MVNIKTLQESPEILLLTSAKPQRRKIFKETGTRPEDITYPDAVRQLLYRGARNGKICLKALLN